MNKYKDYEIGKATNINNFMRGKVQKNFTPSLMDIVKPDGQNEKIKKSREYIWSVALLFAIIKMKTDFVISGFDIIYEEKKIDKYWKELYFDKLDMNTFVKNATFEYLCSGFWTPYVNWNGVEPKYITILNPELIEVETIFGQDLVFMKPDRKILNLLNSDDKEIRKKVKKIIPSKVLEGWKKGKSVYFPEVKRYINLKAYHEKEVHSPIEPIFADLAILQTLQEADYATATKLKQLFLHVKVGDEKFNNGSPVDKKIIEKTEELFENPYKAAELVTQWFVEMKYLIPDLDIFKNEKYESVITRILHWSGVEVMFNSTKGGSSFAEGVIKLRSMKQEINNIRISIKRFLNGFNKKIAKKNNLTYYKELKIPRIKFNKNVLDDPKDVSKMLKFLYEEGTLSIETLHEESGHDFAFEINKKEEEKEIGDKIYVHHESHQGMGGVDKKGDESREEDGDNGNNQPKPSD